MEQSAHNARLITTTTMGFTPEGFSERTCRTQLPGTPPAHTRPEDLLRSNPQPSSDSTATALTAI